MGNIYINWREPGRLDAARAYVQKLGYDGGATALSQAWDRIITPNMLRSVIKRYGAERVLTKPRICVLDIETAPIMAYVWDIWDQNIGLEQIVQEWTIIAFSVKWLGDKKAIYHDTGGRGTKRVRDDRALMQKLWDILNEADIVVTQNGKKFDLRKIRTRMVYHGMKPFSPIKVVDTMLEAKRVLGNTSNKLLWMSEYFTENKKSTHKKFPGFILWKECMADNPAAWAEMKKYNIQDVITTEELYLILLPWMEDHPNVAAYINDIKLRCPKCGSDQLTAEGIAYGQSAEYTRFLCGNCGYWPRTRYTQNTVNKRRSLLA
jgi:ribosomal protein S27AE